jgi:hypothetical protein
MTRLALALTIVFGSAACGSNDMSRGTGGSSGGMAGAGGGMAGGGGGGAGGAGGGGGGGQGGSGGSSGDVVTMTMSFPVPPGEVFMCQRYANPFGGQDAEIVKYESHMSQGSHHFFLFYDDSNTNEAAPSPCPAGGFEFHPYVYSTQDRDSLLEYPAGVASLMRGNKGYMLNSHYVNTTGQMLSATVTVLLHLAPAGSNNQHAGVVFMNDIGITVPPGDSWSSDSCSIDYDVYLMGAGSHMHQRATGFDARTNAGTELYTTTEWADPVPRVFNPPMHISAGTRVTWKCHYFNETQQTLGFGESALDNVMCIFSAQYYPVPAGHEDPRIGCGGIF